MNDNKVNPATVLLFLVLSISISVLTSQIIENKSNLTSNTFNETVESDNILISNSTSGKPLSDSIFSGDFTHEVKTSNKLQEDYTIDNKLYEDFGVIEYPMESDTLLWQFFQRLYHAGNSQVRIMHFGDSQIEGDHITATLRNCFQADFGGSGSGLLPMVLPFGSLSVKIESSPNWYMVTPRYTADSLTKDVVFPLTGCFYSYYPVQTFAGQQLDEQAWIRFTQLTLKQHPSANYDVLRLIYRFNPEPTPVIIQQKGLTAKIDTLDTAKGYISETWNIMLRKLDLTISFYSRQSPQFIGFSTESRIGVIVDNIPSRGSSGLDFIKCDTVSAVFVSRNLKPALLILQFGVNVAPYITNDYHFYQKAFYNQLVFLKKFLGNIPILVVGISDMAKRDGNTVQSYPNIEMIRDAMRNAAFNAHCPFWDLYKAMGGKNSMVKWVNHSPALARKDFIHFNTRGADSVGHMLYNALINDYRIFLNKTGLPLP